VLVRVIPHTPTPILSPITFLDWILILNGGGILLSRELIGGRSESIVPTLITKVITRLGIGIISKGGVEVQRVLPHSQLNPSRVLLLLLLWVWFRVSGATI